MSAFLQDIRYTLRTLRRSAGLTAVIVISLAIGIGANTAVFSVVNALLLKPLPYPDPDRLVVLWLRSPGINIPQDWPSPGQYVDVKNENRSFDVMSISQGRTATMLGLEQPERVEALLTSSTLFPMLGATPLFGRLLAASDETPGKHTVAVLSHGFWKRAFGGDPAIVGKTIQLNNFGVPGTGDTKNQFEVVGVLGPGFLMSPEVMPTVGSILQMDVYLPLAFSRDPATLRGDENYNIMARLKPGVTLAQADDDVAAIAARIREKDKRDRTFTIDVVSLVDSMVGNVRLAVLVLLGSVTLVLLIACANVANLLLTRATGRQKEVAVRTALGASWQRLVRQMLTESILLGVIGGMAGLAIAYGALQVLRTTNPGNIPRLDAITLDATVLAFTLAISIATGVIFGLVPRCRRELRVREQLVRMRTQAINLLRAQLRQEGYRLARGAAEGTVGRYKQLALPTALTTALQPLLDVLTHLADALGQADRRTTARASADPVVRRLMTVPGVGPITALTFRATLDDVTRFRDAAATSAFVGLVPSENSSAERRRRGPITKRGPGTLRSLLIQAAWVCWRRRTAGGQLYAWVERLAARRKKPVAVVALARRLTRILYAMWRDGTEYRPGPVAVTG